MSTHTHTPFYGSIYNNMKTISCFQYNLKGHSTENLISYGTQCDHVVVFANAGNSAVWALKPNSPKGLPESVTDHHP